MGTQRQPLQPVALADGQRSRAARSRGDSLGRVFVDGRFRVATFLKSLLAITSRRSYRARTHGGALRNQSAVILIHDYSHLRDYGVVERFADMEACAGSLAAFRPKSANEIDEAAMRQVI